MSSSLEFLPADYVCVQSRRRQAGWRRLALVLLTALVAGGIVNESHRHSLTEQRRIAIADRLKSLPRPTASPDPLRQRLAELERQANAQAELDLAIRPSRVLGAVSSALPAGSRLVRFDLSRGTLPPIDTASLNVAEPSPAAHREPSPPGKAPLHVFLQGVAIDEDRVSQFLAGLEHSRLFGTIDLKHIERTHGADGPRREFEIELIVEAPPSRTAAGVAPGLVVRHVTGDGHELDLPPSLQPPTGRTP